MMKNDDFKLLRGFADGQTDERMDKRTDNCDCRVVFAIEIFFADLRDLGNDRKQIKKVPTPPLSVKFHTFFSSETFPLVCYHLVLLKLHIKVTNTI